MGGLNEEHQPERDGNPPDVEKTSVQRLESHLLSTMASGLIVLIPLIITILVLQFVVVYLDGIFRGEGGLLTDRAKGTPLDFPGVGITFLVIILYVVGLLVSGRVGRQRVMRWQGVVLSRIPIVKTIYGVAHQATEALTSPTGHRFSRVVFIEWPRAGYMALGFVTGHCHSPAAGKTLLVVYVPTVPNPTSGNLAFVSEEDIIETDMSVEDAMKVVLSAGIVLPEDMTMKVKPSLSDLQQN